MNTSDIFAASSIVWPLTFLLIALLILKRIRDDVRPIFRAMVDPLAKQAQTNAVAWAIGIMLGIQSSMGALKEVADAMGWIVVANMCKIVGPGLCTIVALIMKSPTEKKNEQQVVPPPTPPPQQQG